LLIVSGKLKQVLISGEKTFTANLNISSDRNVPFRKVWAENSGFGFAFPSVVSNVPKTEDQSEAAKAA